MKGARQRLLVFLRRMGEQVVPTVPLDEYVKDSSRITSSLLENIAKRYTTTVASCKRSIDKALAGRKEALLDVGKEYANLIDELSKGSPEVQVVNLMGILSKDLGIDRNTLESYFLKYQSLVLGVNQRGSPKDRIERVLLEKGRPLSPHDIALSTALNYNTVRRLIREMVSDGILTTIGKGRYVLSKSRHTFPN